MEKVNVLILESEPMIQQIRAVFEQNDWGIHVLERADVSKQKQIHVLLTNQIDAQDIAQYKEQFPNIKILLLTDQHTHRIPIDVDAQLKKPFKAKELLDVIEKLTEKTKTVSIDEQFKALSDPTRRKILDYLQDRTLTAGEIADICASTKPNISQHLKVLKNSGLIQEEKKGLYVHYSLCKADFQETKREVGQVLNIKEKILYDMQQLAYKKNCEPVVGATDSQDDGTFYIMKDSETLISFHYSFRLSSFVVTFDIPLHFRNLGNYQIRYEEVKKIEELYERINEELIRHTADKEKERETFEIMQDDVMKYMNEKTSHMNLFLHTDEKTLEQLNEWMTHYIQSNYRKWMDTTEMDEIKQTVLVELTTLGIIQPLMDDNSVSEIMINAYNDVWIEQRGEVKKTSVVFQSEEALERFAKKIANYMGRRVDRRNPILRGTLSDQSKVTIVLPPVAISSITVTIRKFSVEPLTMEDLIRFRTITQEGADFLKAAVEAKANILLSGTAGAGKNTSLQVLSQMIPLKERLVILDTEQTWSLPHENTVQLQTRDANSEGVGAITMKTCFEVAKTLRPDRILLGELSDDIAFDFIQAGTHGHEGLMTSLYGNHALDALERLAQTIVSKDVAYRYEDIQQRIANSIDLVVHVERLNDGSRKITEIVQVFTSGEEGKNFSTYPLFKWTTHGDFVYTGDELTTALSEKFQREQVFNPLHNLSVIGTQKETEKMEQEMPLFVENIADAIASGFSLTSAFTHQYKEENSGLSQRFYRIVQDAEEAMPLQNSILNLKNRTASPQMHLLLHGLFIADKTGYHMEQMLRSVQVILHQRNKLLNHFTYDQKEQLYARPDWQWMEFLDLLSFAYKMTQSFERAIDLVHECLTNQFSEAFKSAAEEMRKGRRFKEALEEVQRELDRPEVTMFVKKLSTAENFGIGIESAIGTQALTWRSQMKQKTK